MPKKPTLDINKNGFLEGAKAIHHYFEKLKKLFFKQQKQVRQYIRLRKKKLRAHLLMELLYLQDMANQLLALMNIFENRNQKKLEREEENKLKLGARLKALLKKLIFDPLKTLYDWIAKLVKSCLITFREAAIALKIIRKIPKEYLSQKAGLQHKVHVHKMKPMPGLKNIPNLKHELKKTNCFCPAFCWFKQKCGVRCVPQTTRHTPDPYRRRLTAAAA